eukprot:sb/3465265/
MSYIKHLSLSFSLSLSLSRSSSSSSSSLSIFINHCLYSPLRRHQSIHLLYNILTLSIQFDIATLLVITKRTIEKGIKSSINYTNQNNGSYLGLYTCFMVPHEEAPIIMLYNILTLSIQFDIATLLVITKRTIEKGIKSSINYTNQNNGSYLGLYTCYLYTCFMVPHEEAPIIIALRPVFCYWEPTDTSKQPIRTRYLGPTTGHNVPESIVRIIFEAHSRARAPLVMFLGKPLPCIHLHLEMLPFSQLTNQNIILCRRWGIFMIHIYLEIIIRKLIWAMAAAQTNKQTDRQLQTNRTPVPISLVIPNFAGGGYTLEITTFFRHLGMAVRSTDIERFLRYLVIIVVLNIHQLFLKNLGNDLFNYTNQNNGSYLGLYTCFMVPHEEAPIINVVIYYLITHLSGTDRHK